MGSGIVAELVPGNAIAETAGCTGRSADSNGASGSNGKIGGVIDVTCDAGDVLGVVASDSADVAG